MKQKKVMLLGGLRYLLPVIEAAHRQGYYVITTCDYLPNNVAHNYSDEYCNVSIIDKEAVLKDAQKNRLRYMWISENLLQCCQEEKNCQ